MALMMAISDILGLIEIARKKSPRLFFARIGQRQKKNEGEREEREKREFIQIFVHLPIPVVLVESLVWQVDFDNHSPQQIKMPRS